VTSAIYQVLIRLYADSLGQNLLILNRNSWCYSEKNQGRHLERATGIYRPQRFMILFFPVICTSETVLLLQEQYVTQTETFPLPTIYWNDATGVIWKCPKVPVFWNMQTQCSLDVGRGKDRTLLTLAVLAGVAVDTLAAVRAWRCACAGRLAAATVLAWLAAAIRVYTVTQ